MNGEEKPPVIRVAALQDAAGIRAIYAPIVRDTPTSFELAPPSEDDMTARVTKTLARYPWLVCATQERLLGYAYAGQHSAREAYQWSVNVSAYLHPHARRRGIGRALYRVLFSILRLQGFYSAYAGITLPNAASVGLHESLGFTPIGAYEQVGFKLGTWHDVGYWQLALQPRKGEPSPPQPLPSILKSPLLQRELKTGSDSLTFQPQEIAGLFDAAHHPNQE